ncbi:MAG: GNAT family protein [Dehalococcoidia bacterium]|nr:GNAT family N-acetyltransferase [Dehalococcoidia bacterium]MCB9485013.1 GNAT family N-acetyltransferase [Thermoflexaceae bacterium]
MSEERLNDFGQPIGYAVEAWVACPHPPAIALEGRYCILEPLDLERHAGHLFAAYSADDGRMWTYLPYGPFTNLEDFEAHIERFAGRDDPQFYAILDRTSGRALGVASYLRVDPAMGVIEVGHLAYSPALQRTAIATEAMYLMMKNAFDLGYRRYEWKCDSFNLPSRAAAERLGFQYEGTFRQAVVTKGRNRDTAWFSILDSEWPALRESFEHWLAPGNFDTTGNQLTPLRSITL